MVAVIRFGGGRRQGLTSTGALGVAAVGVAGLAVAATPVFAVGSAVLLGLGSGLFSTQIGPLVLGSAPASHLSRVQALLTLVQSLALLLLNNLLGGIAHFEGPGVALAVCATGLAAAAVLGLSTRQFRR